MRHRNYRQTLVDAAGHVWGPLKIRQVNSHEVMTNVEFMCKTSFRQDAWTLEARFPLAMIAKDAPKDGACWPANLVRVANSGDAAGEHYSSWSDIPRMQFHQYNLGTWSLIAFHDAALTPGEAARTTESLNAGCAQTRQTCAAGQERLAAFDRAVAGKENLAAAPGAHWLGGTGRSRQFELVWDKAPATFDAARVIWTNRRVIRPWYTIEYWDGHKYCLIEERRDNDREVSVHEFAPVTASRLRLTLWPDLNGWTDVPSVKAVEVFKR